MIAKTLLGCSFSGAIMYRAAEREPTKEKKQAH